MSPGSALPKINVLFVSGIPDNRRVEVLEVDERGQLGYKFTGTCDFYRYIRTPVWRKKHIMLDLRDNEIVLTRDTHILINQIAEADTHRKVLTKLDQVVKTYPEVPVLNAPEHILKTTRSEIYRRLHNLDEKLIVPQVQRFAPTHPEQIREAIAEHGFEYPVILRECGGHGGHKAVRIENEAGTDQLHELALDGRDYYLVQYVECANEGVYHKYRLVIINGEAFIRHLRYSDHWMIHRESCKPFMHKNPVYAEKARNVLEDFYGDMKSDLAPLIQKIHERIPLDYFGIDCALLPDGSMLLFELNANMLILKDFQQPGASISEGTLRKMKTAVIEHVNRLTKK